MIWERLQAAVLDAAVGAWTSITAGIPGPAPVLETGPGLIAGVMGSLGDLCEWAPVGLFPVCVGVIVACWIAALAVHVARVVWSMFTFGGGSV